MSNFNNQFATQKLRETVEVEETSTTTGSGPYLTKPGAKQHTPIPTSGYKKVKGLRPGHSKITIVEPKDLWNLNEEDFKEVVAKSDKDKVEKLLNIVKGKDPQLYNKFLYWMSEPYPHDYDEFSKEAGINEVGVKDTPEKVIKYTNGENIVKGDKVKISTDTVKDGYGFVSGFKDDKILVTVERDKGSSQPRENFPVNPEEIEKREDNLQEGVKTEIVKRDKSQQFHEATKLVNKKLKEINSILEYASELKTHLSEDASYKYNQPLMEKVKGRVVSAYKKLKDLES
jgi:hypothetical protein